MRECGNLSGWTTQPMIRHRTRQGETMFDDIQPVHAVFGSAYAPARSETAHYFEIALTAIEKIAVQRKNHVGAIQFRQHPRVGAESCLHRHVCFLTKAWLVKRPPSSPA